MIPALPLSTPSEQGVDAAGIIGLLDAAEATGWQLHSLALARHGHEVCAGWWDPYRPDLPHLVYSLSKSLTASTLATLVADGLDLDDPVLAHLPVPAARVDPRWGPVTLRHCLTMTTGHTADAWRWRGEVTTSHPFLEEVLAVPPDGEPGAVFCYNQVATYLLARVITHRTDMPLPQAAHELVLGPLGIVEPPWQTDSEGHALGFSGAHLHTRDILRLAQLWLDGGRASGREILPAGFLTEGTVPFLPFTGEASTPWSRGYGHSFWIADESFRGDGAFGQYAVVFPEQQAVLAITSEVADMAAAGELIRTHLLPALGGAEGRPGTADADAALARRLADAALARRLADARYEVGTGSRPLTATPPASARPAQPEAAKHRAGQAGPTQPEAAQPRTMHLSRAASSTLPPDWSGGTITVDGGTTHLRLRAGQASTAVVLRPGHWTETDWSRDGLRLPVAASGGWDGDELTAQVRVIETPHTINVHAAGGELELTWRMVPLNGPDPFLLAVRAAR